MEFGAPFGIGYTGDFRGRDRSKSHRAGGDLVQIAHGEADDFAEAERDQSEVVAPQSQGRSAEQNSQNGGADPRQQHGGNPADLEGVGRNFHHQNPGNIGSHPEERSDTEVEYTGITDDDVQVPPDWLAVLTHPLFSGSADVAVGKVTLAPHLLRPWMMPTHRVYFASTEMTQMPDFVGANVAFHRRVLGQVPGFDVRLGPGQLGYGDDTLVARQLAMAGFRFAFVEAAAVEHHFDPKRLTRNNMLEMSRRFGRTSAYLNYHWSGRHIRWVGLRLLKTIARLLLWRSLHLPAVLRQEGLDLAEAHRLSGVHFYLQWRRESRTPRRGKADLMDRDHVP